MSGPIRPPLKVQEQDGNPSVRPVNTIKVTNGTLTDDGGAVVSVTTGGGGGGTMDNFDIGADTGTAETVDNGEEIKFLGGTGLETAVAATNAITTTLSDTSVVAGSYTLTGITVDAQGRITSASSGTATVEGTAVLSTGETGATKFLREDGDGTSSWQAATATVEGTAVLSTGETGATKFLREDGDGTSSWQAATATIPDPLRLDSGAAATPTYSFSSDTDTGFFLDGSNSISMTGGGARQMTFQPNGLLRLGDGTNAAQLSTYSTNLVIDTDAGTDSGSITLQQGADQDILIEPDGTGIISFYTGANAWTIENGQGGANQVLTTDGAGAATWEDAAGGGTAGAAQIIGVPYGFNSGTDMAMLNRSPFGTIKTAAKSWSQSGCQCYPFIARKSGVIDTATLYVSATGGTTTGTLDFGIYSDSAGVPNAKLGECSFDPTTASQQTETVDSSVTTVAGSQYWAVLVPNGTDANPSIYANNLTYEMGLGVHSSTFGEGNPVLRSSSDTTLPASFTASNLAPSDFPRYGLGVKYT